MTNQPIAFFRRFLAVATALAVGLQALPVSALAGEHAHCLSQAQQPADDHHAGDHQPASLASINAAPSAADCDHCPPEQCHRAALCAGLLLALSNAPEPSLKAPALAAATGPTWRPSYSRSWHPPTPPPTALL